MPPPAAASDRDSSGAASTTHRATTPSKDNHATTYTTPKKTACQSPDDGSSGGNTPKSAQAAAAAASRQRSATKKGEPPTLLTDFLLGRQSPARIAAERERRRSLEAVKAELKHEMKQAKVRQLQPPGGVKERVNAWQKNNAVAGTANVDDKASEPDDIAFRDEKDSVNEDDRIRIKFKQAKRKSSHSRPNVRADPISETDKHNCDESNQSSRSASPPKKRVVSDDNWMKRKGKRSPPRGRISPRVKTVSSPTPLPKDFVLRSTPNPPVSNKVKAWADKVEMSDTSSNRSHRSSKSIGGSPASYDGQSTSTSRLSSGQHTTRLHRKTKSESTGKYTIKPTRKSLSGREAGKVSLEATSKSDVNSEFSGTIPSTSDFETFKNNRKPASHNRGNDQDSHASNASHETPTKALKSRRKSSVGQKNTASVEKDDSQTASSRTQGHAGEGDSAINYSLEGSDLSLANKSVADLPGEIPFGHSAFSELDLPSTGVARSRPKKPRPDRNSSLKGMSVFKKVVEEGKKMIQDMNEQPRQPAENKPPSIEKWLSTTVDPFVESKQDAASSKATHSQPTQPSEDPETPTKEPAARQKASLEIPPEGDAPEPKKDVTSSTPDTHKPSSESKASKSPNSGLQRRRATRTSSSPLKPGPKRPFLGALKDAFQGESSGHSHLPKPYQSHEHRQIDGDDWSSGYDTQSDIYKDSQVDSDLSSEPKDRTSMHVREHHASPMSGPRLPPPTRGRELSTILSGEVSSGSDVTSVMTESTLTQSTALTKGSDLSQPQRKSSGLKRRLTKHSDLVSVLSLPDRDVPHRVKSGRSRPSQRRTRSGASVSVSDLLAEFVEDEDIFARELKTLVDGVIPVLLSQVVRGGSVAELFNTSLQSWQADHLSKSVVSMGVSLEKLRNAHRRAPHHDVRRLADWAHGVVPIYSNYLSSWRLGFQNLIVNLAPRDEANAENDSLLNALPRNESGDVINDQGERVDVAHLLKRPLVRIKHITKMLRCIDSILATSETAEILRDFESLLEKTRRRHREELARMTDEEAAGTDTSRAREMQTLTQADRITIDPTLQVNAKDIFSLNFAHSNGQRLVCQVELVQRDSPLHGKGQGDVLIREVGEGQGARSYLLFPPILTTDISARTGDGDYEMVIMVRGTHAGKQWHELLTLSAESEDQILDWLDLLPVSPVPPREPEPSVVGDDDEVNEQSKKLDVPVGVSFSSARDRKRPPSGTGDSPRNLISASARPSSSTEPRSPHERSRPVSSEIHNPRGDQDKRALLEPLIEQELDLGWERTRPLSESMRPDPRTLGKTSPSQEPEFDEDQPPVPPVHQTLSSRSERQDGSSKHLTPPEDDSKAAKRARRRTSSPLKHEYLPSEVSSGSDTASYTDASESDSSDDEIDSIDIPETEVGFSLATEDTSAKADEEIPSDSVLSLTPSNSASQAGLHGRKTAPEENVSRFMATVSRWSDKGLWKEISSTPFSVVVKAGLIEAYFFRTQAAAAQGDAQEDLPQLALDLTPLVLIRQSTAVDLEIRSSVQPHCRLYAHHSGGNFRFRCHNAPECFSLYMSVHHARLNNQKFIQLENEARFRSFGERKSAAEESKASSRRRTWFGRQNSYRGSTRAPDRSQDGASTTPSSSPSASSFLKRLTVAGSLSFNLARSSVDKQSKAGTNSLYTSGSSSSGTPPRSPSMSLNYNGGQDPTNLSPENIRIRLHLLVTTAKWEDLGNCSLQVRRPPPGWHQALRADHGLEKRITVTTMPKKESDKPRIILDAVLGSACFTPMGTRGIICGIWEEMKGEGGVAGAVPATGATGGNVRKWCFQFASNVEANWVLRLVHQEVIRA